MLSLPKKCLVVFLHLSLLLQSSGWRQLLRKRLRLTRKWCNAKELNIKKRISHLNKGFRMFLWCFKTQNCQQNTNTTLPQLKEHSKSLPLFKYFSIFCWLNSYVGDQQINGYIARLGENVPDFNQQATFCSSAPDQISDDETRSLLKVMKVGGKVSFLQELKCVWKNFGNSCKTKSKF